MASSSIFMYEVITSNSKIASDIYKAIEELTDDSGSYFDLDLISENELNGKYIIVQNVEETFYNIENRTFEKRVAPRATIIYFDLIGTKLEIWSNKTNARRLVFLLTNLLNGITIGAIGISIEDIITKLSTYKVKVSKVSFEDFLFTEDIVGNFIVDLSSYGDAFSVLHKYQRKVIRMTIIVPCDSTSLKISLTSKGAITVYKQRDTLRDDEMALLHSLLLKRGDK